MIELDFHETLTVWGEHLAINRDMNWRGMGTHASNPSSIWRLLCSVSMPDLTKNGFSNAILVVFPQQ